METYRITHYGEDVLRQQGKPVTEFNEALGEIADRMIETMYEANGIGLAAQQVGLPLMLCVMDVRPEEGPPPFFYSLDGKQPSLDEWMPIAMCNPVVTILPRGEDVMEEGCLSFPEIRGEVLRPDLVEVAFKDIEGNPHILRCDGLLGRCVQHEVDHLNGVLFIDRMNPKVVRNLEKKIKRLQRETRKRLKKL
jgi:peptide deformylase